MSASTAPCKAKDSVVLSFAEYSETVARCQKLHLRWVRLVELLRDEMQVGVIVDAKGEPHVWDMEA